jgi:NADP-dependent 3-hydroxy acid dehydrogenase YdfG
MSTTIIVSNSQRKPKLLGQTVIVIGGTARIGLETARRARTEGAKLILIGRNPETLQRAAREVDALSTTAFDATDPALVEQFFCNLPNRAAFVLTNALVWTTFTSTSVPFRTP